MKAKVTVIPMRVKKKKKQTLETIINNMENWLGEFKINAELNLLISLLCKDEVEN